MSGIEEIACDGLRLRYFVGETKENRGAHMGIEYRYLYLEVQCILEFEGMHKKSPPPPIAFIIKTRQERPEDFNPNFKAYLLHDGRGNPAPDAAYGHLLKLFWTRLNDGTPRLPFPVIDLNQGSIFG